MKHQTIKIILAVIVKIATCLLAVFLLNRPVILSILNLSNSGNIGSAIGGISDPIIGLAASIKDLYSKFYESNNLSLN